MTVLPEEFTDRMIKQLGNEADQFFLSLQSPSPTSIRLHHHKGRSSFAGMQNVPWCENGFYLESRPYFHMDPHWHGGAYYVQEASSMILDYVIKQIATEHKARIWLDACAAPGGKTGIIAKHLNKEDVLVANEIISPRRSVLWENLSKAGFINTFVTGEPSSSFSRPLADVILVDAPCSGEGMMRKEPEAIQQWSNHLVRECAVLQGRIVTDIIRALKPEGYLIYSTCSYSADENIQNVMRFHEHELSSVKFDFPAEWNIVEVVFNDAIGYQLYPHKVKGEGLFISVLKNEKPDTPVKSSIRKLPSAFTKIPDWLKVNLTNDVDLLLQKNSEQNLIIGSSAEGKANEVLQYFSKADNLAAAGQLKGKDYIPSHYLAMSGLYNQTTEQIDNELEISLDYLERNVTSLPSAYANGWYLMAYQKTVLGWAKKTTQGWKNHFPLNWRLRSRKML